MRFHWEPGIKEDQRLDRFDLWRQPITLHVAQKTKVASATLNRHFERLAS